MNIIRHIPNTLTCLNLISGMAGIYFVLEGHIYYGAYFILLAAFFDFFDGFAARMLKVSSDIGKELDSLADLVTFGVLPAFIIFKMMMDINNESYLPFITFLIGVFSAIRLAKFNVDTRQTERFIGLPTPANALLLSALPFTALHVEWVADLLINNYFLAGLSVVMSLLLVAEIPLIALKFKNFGVKDNIYRYLVLLISIVSVLWLGLGGIPLVIISYVGLSLIENAILKNTQG
ncbi:CDP-diacylglycerol--serine O-phosphatidyltransferase [Anditalea andensis]|uniref:CDP-diacylglycerol--serine O-phosphatidyltransferase n=1 Tax=Anditalea andensis TaxID=1048983 RepID=A0A074LLD8_9BACT|nr:CDP-diacylglycerol--serine O-phosphatidyltransferase [Anditalea andensis]KEO74647.1 CDP-diacylglycerol--serine O-phosphatidyltransferase [Anditalea andensis]